MTDGAMITTAYELAKTVHQIVSQFSDKKRDTIGQRLCDTSVDVAAQVQDALTTDDPVEQQEALRLAGLDGIALEILVRIGADMGLIGPNESKKLNTLIVAVRDGIDMERRTVRRNPE